MYKHYIGWMSERFQWRIVRDPREETEQKRLCAYKNLLTCEAHHSFIKNAYKLYMNHEFDYAKTLYEDSNKRAKMPL